MSAGKLVCVLTIVFFISTSTTCLKDGKDKKSKSITTFLNAKWESTPVVLELAEYLASENSNLFWPFIDNINALKTKLDKLGTEKDVYEACIGVASSLVSPAQLRMAKLAISMHTTSPIVRMFDQIATQNGAKQVPCNTFVNVASKMICDNDELEKILKTLNNYKIDDHKVETYSLDHYYNVYNPNTSMTAILYGQLGSSDFATKHKILTSYADSGDINYIVRWNVKAEGKPKVRLSGYGVELQLKSTEYKSQDDSTPKENESSDVPSQFEEEDENDPQNQVGGFNFSKLKNLFPALRTPLERFRRHLSESSEELAPLKVWQMQGLSMQAAAAVVDAHVSGSDESLKVLKSISQNFPMQAKSLIHVNVPRAFRDEVLSNQDIWASSFGLRAAESLLLVSGIQYSPDELDFYALLEDLKEDIGPMNVLRSLGLSKKLINELMVLGLESFSYEDYGIDIRDTAITWLNDLEKDERYRRWPSEYIDLLKPTYPGMLRHLRRNIFNYIMVVDPISKSSLPPLTMAENLLKHSAPVRVGLILAPVHGRTGEQLALESAVRAAFNYVSQEKNSNKEAFYFLTQLLESTTGEEVTFDNIKKILKKFAYSSADLDEIISEDSEYNFGKQISEEFVSKLGNKLPEVLVNGVPVRDETGSVVTSSVDLLEVTLVGTLWRGMEVLQKAIFKGELTNKDDAVDFLMKQPHIVPRLNRRVLSSESSQYLDLSGVAASAESFTEDKIHKLMAISGRDALATAVSVMKYFTNSNKAQDFTQTIWVIGDLNQEGSRQLLRDALTFMRESGGVRVAFIPNVEGDSNVDQSLNKVVLAALSTLEPAKATKYVAELLENDGCHERKDCDILAELVPVLNKFEWVLKASRVLSVRSMKLRPSARAIVHNARLIGPFGDDELFSVEDFALLERFVACF